MIALTWSAVTEHSTLTAELCLFPSCRGCSGEPPVDDDDPPGAVP